MLNGFNSIQESSLEMTLTGLRQEKYIQLFNKKGVTKFDTFVNMTEEDLLYAGITDVDDRKKILDGIRPLKHLYKEVNELGPPDLNMMIGNNIHHIRTHLGSLIILKRELVRRKPKNILIDSSHSSIHAINTLLEILKDQLEYIESDITFEEEDIKPNSNRGKIFYIGILVSCTIGALAVSKYLGFNTLKTLKYLKLPSFVK